MTTNASVGPDAVNGLRALELGSALLLLRDQLRQRLESGSRTISTVGTRTREEQEIIGLSQILFVMFPLAIELALKSLRGHVHAHGRYDPKHELDDLFCSITECARDPDEARKAQDEARELWNQCQVKKQVSYTGTLDQFLKEHRNDFIKIRYYDWSSFKNQQINNLVACYFCVLQPLITRDPETRTNFANLFAGTGHELQQASRLI